MTICVLLSPLALVLFLRYPIVSPGWWYVVGTALLHAVYFILLGRSYNRADFSLVYPIARGIGAATVPVLGVLILGESVTLPAVAGILAVLLGIFTVYWWGHLSQLLQDPFRLMRDSGTRYAVFTGVVIATYSVWDKVGVRYVDPFLYMYLMTLGSVLSLAPYIMRTHGAGRIRAEWRARPRSIVVAGLLTFLAYGMVLKAFTLSQVSYVSPSREIGIVMSVLLGTFVLKEPFGKGRAMGSGLIVVGLVLIATAP